MVSLAKKVKKMYTLNKTKTRVVQCTPKGSRRVYTSGKLVPKGQRCFRLKSAANKALKIHKSKSTGTSKSRSGSRLSKKCSGFGASKKANSTKKKGKVGGNRGNNKQIIAKWRKKVIKSGIKYGTLPAIVAVLLLNRKMLPMKYRTMITRVKNMMMKGKPVGRTLGEQVKKAQKQLKKAHKNNKLKHLPPRLKSGVVKFGAKKASTKKKGKGKKTTVAKKTKRRPTIPSFIKQSGGIVPVWVWKMVTSVGSAAAITLLAKKYNWSPNLREKFKDVAKRFAQTGKINTEELTRAVSEEVTLSVSPKQPMESMAELQHSVFGAKPKSKKRKPTKKKPAKKKKKSVPKKISVAQVTKLRKMGLTPSQIKKLKLAGLGIGALAAAGLAKKVIDKKRRSMTTHPSVESPTYISSIDSQFGNRNMNYGFGRYL
jgi:hypothetical protein